VEMTQDTACVVYVPESKIPLLIGKKGETVNAIEKKLGVHIDIRPLVLPPAKTEVPFEVTFVGKSIIFSLDHNLVNHDISILVNDDYLLTAKVSKKGIIKVKKNNKIGTIIAIAVNAGEHLKLVA
jgi:ATPase